MEGFCLQISCGYAHPLALWQGPTDPGRHGQIKGWGSFKEGKVGFNWEDQGNLDERVDI